jgi:hypothetical protein
MQQPHKFITSGLCVAQHVWGAFPLIMMSVQLHWKPLVLPLKRGGWSVVGRALPRARQRPTTLQPPRSNGKTRGSQCSCTLLMMDGEASETY